jgi:hypothetical protein
MPDFLQAAASQQRQQSADQDTWRHPAQAPVAASVQHTSADAERTQRLYHIKRCTFPTSLPTHQQLDPKRATLPGHQKTLKWHPHDAHCCTCSLSLSFLLYCLSSHQRLQHGMWYTHWPKTATHSTHLTHSAANAACRRVFFSTVCPCISACSMACVTHIGQKQRHTGLT